MACRVAALVTFLAALTFVRCSSAADEPATEQNLKPVLTAVEHQPLRPHTLERISKRLELVGAPLNNDQQKQLRAGHRKQRRHKASKRSRPCSIRSAWRA